MLLKSKKIKYLTVIGTFSIISTAYFLQASSYYEKKHFYKEKKQQTNKIVKSLDDKKEIKVTVKAKIESDNKVNFKKDIEDKVAKTVVDTDNKVQIKDDSIKLVQFLNKNRYLETDSLGKLKPYSKTTLEKLIPMLVSLDDSSYIEIEGYSAQKFYQYQAEQASQNAATNVKNYLVSKLKDKKIIVTNYGDAYPIVDDKKDERNSRVEIKIRRR